ncbi:hypothetical protein WR25_22376 isoform A [Diploscapter pachys]|uniref:DUF4139 domain-containing protein n=1 Tax=Diploscapter pachys TaxID=2018661 RepID=A0A2A2L4D0_9BILA|nr:hypothetical protein WR25_22376 isoform A [Diploscapter pachys]
MMENCRNLNQFIQQTRSTMTSVHSFECREQALQKVLVYNDRAEIKRLVKCDLKPGMNELQIKNLPDSYIHDSVRVTGHGDAIIHEVQAKHVPVTRTEKDSPRLAELRQLVKDKEREINELNAHKEILAKEKDGFDKILIQLGSGAVQPGQSSPFVLNNETFTGLSQFFTFYRNSQVQTKNAIRTDEETLEVKNDELNKLRNELFQIEHRGGHSLTLFVQLETQTGGAITMDLAYQVHNARWRPSYDIRVETGEKKRMTITYFGHVAQGTGEDWTNVQMFLTTAQPCIGGDVPELGTLDVAIRPPTPPPCQPCPTQIQQYGYGAPMMAAAAPRALRKSMARGGGGAERQMMAADCMMDMEVAIATVQSNTTSTEFAIEKLANIPPDNSEHKVTIGAFEVEPHLIYECVPKKSTNVFFVATAVNQSELALLSGEASVFLDNAFVAKSNIKDISPGERFNVSLGVDSSIRISYKPAREYKEQKGVITKNSSNIHEQIVNVKNTRRDGILLTLKEHVPRSTDEKIKVALLEPQAVVNASGEVSVSEMSVAQKEGAKISSANNLEWTVAMPAGSQKDLKIRWQVEFPKDDRVEYCEKF